MVDTNDRSDEIAAGPTLAQQLFIADSIGLRFDSPEQRAPLESRARKKLVAGGERAGKSFYTAFELVSRCPWGKLFWIIGSDYEQARPEFEYAAAWLSELGAIKTPRLDISMPKFGRCYLRTKTGQVIETRSADDVRKIAGRAPSGIVLAEAGQLSYDVYLKAIGRLAEKRGWLIASGTFEGSGGWYAETFDEWQGPNLDDGRSFSVPSWSNRTIYPGGRYDAEIVRLERAYSKSPGLFEERCGAVPAPPSNLVFGQYRDTIHVSELAVYDPKRDVFLAVDASGGTNPYAVGVFQFVDALECGLPIAVQSADEYVDDIQVAMLIDRIYETNMIDEQIIAIAKTRPWWNNVIGGAIDVEAPDSRKRWMKYGGVTLYAKKQEQIEGIRRLQTFLHYKRTPEGAYEKPPHLLVNPTVTEFSYEVRNYKRPKVGSATGGISRLNIEKVPKDVPPSDQPNHLLKATWYLLLARFGHVKSHTKYKTVRTWRNRTSTP